MKSGVLSIYRRWLASATPEQIEFVDSIYYVCEQHYEAGGDIVVETFEPDEVLAWFKSVDEARIYCGLKIEQAANSRWGEDTDPEVQRQHDYDAWEAK
jgi:hypothetical protein